MRFDAFHYAGLGSRIIVTYEAEAQGVTTDSSIKKVFNAVPVP